MNRYTRYLAFAVVGLLVAGGTATAVNLNHPAVQIIAVGYSPCPSHAKHVCWVYLDPDPAVLMPAGGSAWFTPVFTAEAPLLIQQVGSLNGTFNITIYDAYNNCPNGGAEFKITYTAGAGDPAELFWTQGIATNHHRCGRFGVRADYMDVKRPPEPGELGSPYYPYHKPDSSFYDKPLRHCIPGGTVRWIAEAYPTTTPVFGTIKIYEGVEWGFVYTCFAKKKAAAERAGSDDATAQYDANAQTLSVTMPIDVLTNTDDLVVDPVWTLDPLNGGTAVATGMQLHAQQDGMSLFVGGDLYVLDATETPVLHAEIEAVHLDDAMHDEYGFNMVFLFGDIEELAHTPGTFLTDAYFTTLDQADLFQPYMTVSTQEPFSTLVTAGMNASSTAIAIDGFHDAEPPEPFGDGDGNGGVDPADLALFEDCLTGPGGTAEESCLWADSDHDRDVDLADFGPFSMSYGTEPHPYLEGACCLRDGECAIATQYGCEMIRGGFYHGDATTCGMATACDPPIPGMFLINEIWADDPSTDTNEFIEIAGPPNMPLDGLVLLALDGDTGGDLTSINYRRVNFQANLTGLMTGTNGILLLGSGPDLAALPHVDIDAAFGNSNGVPDEIQNGSQTYVLTPLDTVEFCLGVGIPDPECTGTSSLTTASLEMIAEAAVDTVATRDSLWDEIYVFAPAVAGEHLFEFDHAFRIPFTLDTNSPDDWETSAGWELNEFGHPATPGQPN